MPELKVLRGGAVAFFATEQSPLARNRKHIWLGLVLGTLLSAFLSRDSPGGLWAVVLVGLLIGLWTEVGVRRQLKFGQALATLTEEAIEAPRLSAADKRLRWCDIDHIEVAPGHGGRAIVFVLKPGLASNRRAFLTGSRPSRPMLALSLFAPADQERLLDEARRLHRLANTGKADGLPVSNELAEERVFHERLVALAPVPWLTYGLIAANVLVWLLMLGEGSMLTTTPVPTLLDWGGNAASEVQKGQWWRMASAMFVHGGLVHLAANMFGLYAAGTLVERIYGAAPFALLYCGAGLAGSALSLHFAAQSAVSVGASGAVFGVAGALMVAVAQHRRALPHFFRAQMLGGVGFYVVYSLMQGFGTQGIDNAAHVGGLLGGALVAAVLPERFDLTRYAAAIGARSVVAAAVAGVLIVGLVATAPVATLDQGRMIRTDKTLQVLFRLFDKTVATMVADGEAVTAGRMSLIEADERSRTVHAPAFRDLLIQLDAADLGRDDPRAPFVEDLRQLTALFAESLAMASAVDVERGQVTPADPVRMDQIQRDIEIVNQRLKDYAAKARPAR